MNYLLMKSLQISFENDASKTMVDIANDVDMTIADLTKAAEELGVPLSSWQKVNTIQSEDVCIVEEAEDVCIVEEAEDACIVEEAEDVCIVDFTLHTLMQPTSHKGQNTMPTASVSKDVIKENLDALTKNILVQARMRIDENNDMDTRELKDLTQIVVSLENLKYPKTNKVGFEVDLQKGIMRFLSEAEQ